MAERLMDKGMWENEKKLKKSEKNASDLQEDGEQLPLCLVPRHLPRRGECSGRGRLNTN